MVLRIQAMILDGAFAIGERLPAERALAAQLSVSRASLREALSILETLGLLRSEPYRGTFVAMNVAENGEAPTPVWRFGNRYSLLEVYQFRLLTEAYSARLAAMAITVTQLAELQQIVQDHKQATRKLDFVTVSQIDFELHHRLAQISGNRILADLHETYSAVFLESQRIPVARHERRWETVDEHEKLLQAIAQHDPDGAEYYMCLHITRAADRVGIALSDTPPSAVETTAQAELSALAGAARGAA
nr:FadR/GntR family transcriptional regulator [Acidibrevibacterium fodinaquatile]